MAKSGYKLRAAVAKAIGWTEHILTPGLFVTQCGTQVRGWMPELSFDDAWAALSMAVEDWPKGRGYMLALDDGRYSMTIFDAPHHECTLAYGDGDSAALAICRALAELNDKEDPES